MAVSATQPGMAVASAADLLAVLTPQGRAMRKIVETEAAAEQMAHWRRIGLRTGLLTVSAASLPVAGLEALRLHCDRLVLCVEAAPGAGDGLVAAASLSGIDLICPFSTGTRSDTLSLLRPDVLLDAGVDVAMADLVHGWGGSVLATAATAS